MNISNVYCMDMHWMFAQSLEERVAPNKTTVVSDGGVSKRKANRFLCQKKKVWICWTFSSSDLCDDGRRLLLHSFSIFCFLWFLALYIFSPDGDVNVLFRDSSVVSWVLFPVDSVALVGWCRRANLVNDKQASWRSLTSWSFYKSNKTPLKHSGLFVSGWIRAENHPVHLRM